MPMNPPRPSPLSPLEALALATAVRFVAKQLQLQVYRVDIGELNNVEFRATQDADGGKTYIAQEIDGSLGAKTWPLRIMPKETRYVLSFTRESKMQYLLIMFMLIALASMEQPKILFEFTIPMEGSDTHVVYAINGELSLQQPPIPADAASTPQGTPACLLRR